jgi:hypothetical protein
MVGIKVCNQSYSIVIPLSIEQLYSIVTGHSEIEEIVLQNSSGVFEIYGNNLTISGRKNWSDFRDRLISTLEIYNTEDKSHYLYDNDDQILIKDKKHFLYIISQNNIQISKALLSNYHRSCGDCEGDFPPELVLESIIDENSKKYNINMDYSSTEEIEELAFYVKENYEYEIEYN